MAAMTSTLPTSRPFASCNTPRTAPARRHVAPIHAAAREEPLRKVAGAAAGAALAISVFASPALALDLPFFGKKNQGGTVPQGDNPTALQTRVTGADSMRGGGQPDKSDTAYPETAGGSGQGNVPPIAGRTNLESTSAAPDKAK